MKQANGTRTRPAGRGGHTTGRMERSVLSGDEVRAIMAAAQKGVGGDRLRCAVAIMFRSGLRVSELLALRPRHVDLERNLVRVENGKGGADRTVGIDDGALLYVERWLARRQAMGLSSRAPLFVTLDGRPWTRQALSASLKAAATRAGIEKRVHPHQLRASMAVEMHLGEGVPVKAVQQQLGHASVATTSVYLDHLAPAELVEIVKARPEWAVA